MMMIGGAAIGAFLISNDGGAVKHTLKDIGKYSKVPNGNLRITKTFYAFCLL